MRSRDTRYATFLPRCRACDSSKRVIKSLLPKSDLSRIAHQPACARAAFLSTVGCVKKAKNDIPQARLEDELWTVEHICTFLRVRPSAAYARVPEPGFPPPCTANRRYRRWSSEAVRRSDRDGRCVFVETLQGLSSGGVGSEPFDSISQDSSRKSEGHRRKA